MGMIFLGSFYSCFHVNQSCLALLNTITRLNQWRLVPFILVTLLLLPGIIHAQTWHFPALGGGPFSSLQAACDAHAARGTQACDSSPNCYYYAECESIQPPKYYRILHCDKDDGECWFAGGYYTQDLDCSLGEVAQGSFDTARNCVASTSSCLNSGNPIEMGTKNKHQVENNIVPDGISRIEFKRYYNSQAIYWDLWKTGTFGRPWRHTYSRFIETTDDANYVLIKRHNGKFLQYVKSNGEWSSTSDKSETLEDVLDGSGLFIGWKFTINNDIHEIYNTLGQLISIDYPDSYQISLSYDDQNRLETVEDTIGNSLSFSYNLENQINSVTENGSRTWTYRYDVSKRLEYVDNPDTTTRQYHYNELQHTSGANLGNALTGITDERGVDFRYATFEYDVDGNAVASYHGPQTTVLTERIDGVSIT